MVYTNYKNALTGSNALNADWKPVYGGNGGQGSVVVDAIPYDRSGK